MKRLMRWTGLAAAAGAVYWYVSEKVLRPATESPGPPPAFRVAPTPSTVPAKPADDLSEIVGVGPVYEARLVSAGFVTFRQVAEASVEAVSEAAGVANTKAADWIEQARNLAH